MRAWGAHAGTLDLIQRISRKYCTAPMVATTYNPPRWILYKGFASRPMRSAGSHFDPLGPVA